MSYLLAQDALNGKMGKAFATVDGRNVELFGLKKFETSAELEDAKLSVCGTNITQHKPKGMDISGSFTIYYGTPTFIDMVYQYQQTGRFPKLTLQVTNDDPSSSVGAQTVAYYGVVLSKVPLSVLDESADFLEEEVSFGAASFAPLGSFHTPSELGGN